MKLNNKFKDNKFKVGLFVVLVVILVLWWALFNQPPFPQVELSPQSEVFSDNCEELESQINGLLEEANYCSTDSDCVISYEFDFCPFGACHNLINANADLTHIRKGIEIFQENCSECTYNCRQPPSSLSCENNKCVASPTEREEVFVSTDKTEYSIGLNVLATVTNNTDKDIWLNNYCGNLFVLRQYSGLEWEQYWPNLYIDCGFKWIELPAGEEFSEPLNLYEIYDYQGAMGHEDFSIDSGRYKLEMQYLDIDPHKIKIVGEQFFTEVTSNEFSLDKTVLYTAEVEDTGHFQRGKGMSFCGESIHCVYIELSNDYDYSYIETLADNNSMVLVSGTLITESLEEQCENCTGGECQRLYPIDCKDAERTYLFIRTIVELSPQIECVIDNECAACGDKCISTLLNPVIGCEAPIGLECTCVNNQCETIGECSTNSDCSFYNKQNQRPRMYGLCLDGFCVQSCNPEKYVSGCR